MNSARRAAAAIALGLVVLIATSATIARADDAHQGHGSTTQVSAGWFHTCAIADGGAWCWGSNSLGELGIGIVSRSRYPTPVRVAGLTSGVTQISAGRSHTCALKRGGVWCWGLDLEGQLGDNASTPTFSYSPVPVVGLEHGVSQISANRDHTCALKQGGVWCWGSNEIGEIGDGTKLTAKVPQRVVGLADHVREISAGDYSTCAIKVDGALWCWGDNNSGQLGFDEPHFPSVPLPVPGMERATRSVSTGGGHTCVLRLAAVSCWGGSGFLADGTFSSRIFAPVAVIRLQRGVRFITAGENHSCAIKDEGAWCWGENTTGQLGNGTTLASYTPVRVPGLRTGTSWISASYLHTCAVQRGEVWCWGDGGDGELGTGDLIGSTLPVKVIGLP